MTDTTVQYLCVRYTLHIYDFYVVGDTLKTKTKTHTHTRRVSKMWYCRFGRSINTTVSMALSVACDGSGGEGGGGLALSRRVFSRGSCSATQASSHPRVFLFTV